MKITDIVIGTANFGNEKYGIKNYNKNSLTKIKSLINFAQKNGIQKLDTSLEYKGVYNNLSKVNLMGFKVSSKFTLKKYSKNLIKNFRKDFLISLKKLGIKKYDNFFFHNIDDFNNTKKVKDIIEILRIFKKNKLINKIGVSLNSPQEIKKIQKKFRPDIVQIPFNLFDRRILDKKLLSQYKGIEIQIRSIFLQGLLLNKKLKIKKFKKLIDFLDLWHKKKKLNHLESSINFITSQKCIDKYVIGFQNLKQINEILKTKKVKISNFPRYNNDYLKDPRKWID